jgi:hypothetical protein
MKAERARMQGNTGNPRGGVFASGSNGALDPKKATKHRRGQRKTENRLEKQLAKLWGRKKITKTASAGCGQQLIWEMSAYTDAGRCA